MEVFFKLTMNDFLPILLKKIIYLKKINNNNNNSLTPTHIGITAGVPYQKERTFFFLWCRLSFFFFYRCQFAVAVKSFLTDFDEVLERTPQVRQLKRIKLIPYFLVEKSFAYLQCSTMYLCNAYIYIWVQIIKMYIPSMCHKI